MKEIKVRLTETNYKKLMFLMNDYDERKNYKMPTSMEEMLNILVEREHWVFSQKEGR